MQRLIPHEILEECFVPSYATQKKIHGAWYPCTRVLFPGYVIAVTDEIEDLRSSLKKVPEFTRLVSSGEMLLPLDAAERELICAFTNPGERTVEMSVGVKEDTRVVVTSGPLVGHEGWIERVDRRHSVAMLKVEMFGRTLRTKVGLAILAARPGQEAIQLA